MSAPQGQIVLKVTFPHWFRAFYAICAPLALALVGIACLNFARNGFSPSATLKMGFLLVVTGIGLWAGRLIFTTIYAKDSGIEVRVLFAMKQTFPWDDITRVARPRFGIPYDAAYIVSKQGKRITLARSMTGYSELLGLIQAKAPNLTPKELPRNLWPSSSASSWLQIAIGLGLFIAYDLPPKN